MSETDQQPASPWNSRLQWLPADGPSRPARGGTPGGASGLSISLKALRRLTDDVTAPWALLTMAVRAADCAVSSRSPPGDLRMALAALCGDDAWGRTWSQVNAAPI